ncbi:MAG: hypothetical protein A2Z52_00195 [Candidatus Moranbacteria bacterium RBG_19FT_COMBO_42_6]|nr:MAG: hypothetical protein A2Z52_00195 [Candidatus Moranbacteria bacterium RBG_19FT_COMBO_42_6]
MVGAAIGKSVASPWLIIPISVAVHYALDAIPHGEYLDKNSTIKNTWWKVTLDLLAGLLVVIFYIIIKKVDGSEIKNIEFGVFFSLFPDFLTLLYWKMHLHFLKKAYTFHEWIHRLISQKDLPWNFRNARNDILISLVASFFLFI